MLPDSGGVYGLIERSDPLVITDLMEGGGTYLNPQRLGASGASWTQTSFRLGDADITDPDRTGFAMLYPNLNALEAVSVATAGAHPDEYGSGTIVMLTPRMPSATWQRTIEFNTSPPAFQSVNPLPGAPAAARLRNAAGGSFVVSGPLSERLGLLLAGNVIGSTRVERDSPIELSGSVATMSAHLVYRASDRDNVRIFIEGDRLSLPSVTRGRLVDPTAKQRDTVLSCDVHLGAGPSGGHRVGGHADPRTGLVHASVWQVKLVLGTMERLREGPIYEMASAGQSRRRRASLGRVGKPHQFAGSACSIAPSSARPDRGAAPSASRPATRSSANSSTASRHVPGS